MRRAILHIGPKKTATSTIQARLAADRVALADAGMLYPGKGPNQSAELVALFRDAPDPHHRARRHAEDPEFSATAPAALTRFEAEIRTGDWHTLILSSEYAYDFAAHELHRLASWLGSIADSVELVIVLRDPVDWTVSAIQQACKSAPDFAALIADPPRLHWRQTIARFDAAFPGAALHALAFEDLVADPGGPAAALLRHLGLAHVTPGEAIDRRNESLSWEAAMMMVALNQRRPFFRDDQRNPERSGRELSAFLGLAGQRFDLPDTARRAAYDASRADVVWVRDRFGITRYDYPVEHLRPSCAPDGVSPDFMTAVGDRLADLANELRITRNLLAIERLRAKGDTEGAERLRRKSHAKFPADRRFAPKRRDQTSGKPSPRTVVT